ncbi:hypothetical protein KEM52_001445 [Ascosphaera acerosa]|nr:hypothetical protein KEM52_001445 [Ascosphaera acerosa]
MLSLQEIYRWVETHSAKVRGRSKRSWQNSIRHNLSMNGAFKTVKHIDANGKVTSMWSLTPQAVASGVLSTTRYRKPSPRKGVKSAKQDKQRSAATTTANSSRHRRHAAAIPLLLPSPMEDYSSRPFTRQAEPPVLYDEVKGYGPCLGQGRLDTPPASHYNPSSGQFIAESEYECVIPSQEGSPVDPELKDFFTLAQSSYSWSPQHQ